MAVEKKDYYFKAQEGEGKGEKEAEKKLSGLACCVADAVLSLVGVLEK